MESEISVHQAAPDEFERVGVLVYELLAEIYPDLGYERDECIDSARNLLSSSSGWGVWGFLATTADERDVGVAMINECAAIYAGGRFGEITELYVVPDFRSQGVGERLIETVARFARQHGWPDLEVGAPDLPTWQRTFDFYRRHGFEEVGPRLDLPLGNA